MDKYRSQSIAISGDLGSGKSTVAELLGQRLGVPVVSTGGFQRELARRKGLTTLELNRLAEHDKSIDIELDAINSEVEKSQAPTIVDARMAWHFVPSAFKVFLAVDEGLAAERIFAAGRDAEHSYSTVAEALAANQARRHSEVVRFQSKYGVDIARWGNFDLIVNTTAASPESIVDAICDQIWRVPGAPKQTKYLASPKACFPTDAGAYRSIPEEAVEVLGAAYPSIALVYFRGVNLIWGSHHDVAEAILLGRSFIEGRVVASGENGVLPNQLPVRRFLELLPGISTLYDWEEALKFRFYRYPEWFRPT